MVDVVGVVLISSLKNPITKENLDIILRSRLYYPNFYRSHCILLPQKRDRPTQTTITKLYSLSVMMAVTHCAIASGTSVQSILDTTNLNSSVGVFVLPQAPFWRASALCSGRLEPDAVEV